MRGKQGVAYISRRRFSVNDLVPSQSEACDASVPRGAKDRKRTVQDGEKCRAAKRARNSKDLSEQKISRSKLNRNKGTAKERRAFLFRRVMQPVCGQSLSLVRRDKICRLVHMRAARSRLTAEKNVPFVRILCLARGSSHKGLSRLFDFGG